MANSISAAQDGLGTRDEFDEKAWALALELERLDGIEGRVQWPKAIAAALRAEREAGRTEMREAAAVLMINRYGAGSGTAIAHADAIRALRLPEPAK